jgi:hypothetical protein
MYTSYSNKINYSMHLFHLSPLLHGVFRYLRNVTHEALPHKKGEKRQGKCAAVKIKDTI